MDVDAIRSVLFGGIGMSTDAWKLRRETTAHGYRIDLDAKVDVK
jgi:hypothetical protein